MSAKAAYTSSYRGLPPKSPLLPIAAIWSAFCRSAAAGWRIGWSEVIPQDKVLTIPVNPLNSSPNGQTYRGPIHGAPRQPPTTVAAPQARYGKMYRLRATPHQCEV